MSRIAVVCAPGIGDALILQIAAHQLRLHGFEVTTFSNHLASFGNWFQGASFARQPQLNQIEEALGSFDAILLQHDNTPKARKIHSLPRPVYTFYGSHVVSKHGPLRLGYDYVCDQERTMVQNVRAAVETLFRLDGAGVENGMKPPAGLIHRKNAKRVAIHPTSAVEEKNWSKAKFLAVAKWLKEEGYEPAFTVPAAERFEWGGPELLSLEDLASFIYESGYFMGNDSGPGHIASYLGIPYLIIAKDERQMRFWRPGWRPGEIAVPPAWLPNWKGARLREEHWKKFITTKGVINKLKESVLKN